MRLFSVVLFILFNIFLIECKSNRTDSEPEKLIKFRSGKNENAVVGNDEEKKSDEVFYEEYEYSDDGTIDNNILGKGDRIADNNTDSLSGGNGENFPNEVFLSLRNITADAATAFRGFTNKNADLVASASDNLNVTFNGTFDESESGGINRALRDIGHPAEVIAVNNVAPTYQPYTHKKIDTAELSDCALQGEWKPMGIAHQQITVEGDGGSQHEQIDVLQSVGSYAVPNKIIPYWQNSFATGNRGAKVPLNHKPFNNLGSSNSYGGAYGYGGYGGYDLGGSSGSGHFYGNGFSSAGQFQKIKSSSMLSPPPYPPLVIGKKPGFYKSQKSKHKFYNHKRPRPSGYSVGGSSFSSFGSSSYGNDVKGGLYGGHLNLNSNAGLGGDSSLASGNFKQSATGSFGNLYGNGALGGAFGLHQYGSGVNYGNSEIHLGVSNNGKIKFQAGGIGGGGGGGGSGDYSIFSHNSNFGKPHQSIKDLLHYGSGEIVGGKGGTGNGGTQALHQGGGNGGAQVLLHQGGGNGVGIGTGINLVETSHVDLLHPGNQGLSVSGLNLEDSNNAADNSDINHSSSTDSLVNSNGGTSSAFTQEASASNVNTGHSASLVQSGNGGGASITLQQNSFGNIGHSGGVDLLHPGGIALVTGHPQSSALQSGELISASTISSNSNYGLASSNNNKETGTGLTSGFNQGLATGNLITTAGNTLTHGSNVDSGIGHLLLSSSGSGHIGHSGPSYLTPNLNQLSYGLSYGGGEKLIPDPSYLKSLYGQSIRNGNSLSDSSFLSSQISQNFHFNGQDPSTFTCGKNHDHNTNYHTATFQVADNDHPSSVDVLQYQGDSAVLIKAESVPFHDKISPERKNYNSLEAEPSSEIISQTVPLSAEQETGQTENEPKKAEDDEEPEHKSYYHEVTKVTKIPATSVGNVQYTYSEYDTRPQTFSQETEISNEEQETERPQIIKELEQLTNKFQLDPDNPQKLFEDPPTKEVNYPFHKNEHHHEEAERYHYTSQDYTVKNQAHDFVTEFPSRFTSSPPAQLIYKKPYVKYVSRPGNSLIFQKPKPNYFPSKVPVNLLRQQKPIQFNKNQNYKVKELGGERHRPLGEIFPTQKSPKQFYNSKPNFAVEVPKGGWPKGSKSGYQVNFTNSKVIKKITTNKQKTLAPILIQKHAKLTPQVIRVVKVSA